MKNISLKLLFIFSFIGLLISGYLTREHFQILKGGQGPGFCSWNETFNCSAVLSSGYASIGPLPVAGLGLLFYLYLILSVIQTRFVKDVRQSLGLPFILFIPGLLLTLYLTGIVSGLLLKNFCILCLSITLVTWVCFFLLGKVMQVTPRYYFSFCQNYLKALFKKKYQLPFHPQFFSSVTLAILIFCIGGGILAIQHYRSSFDKTKLLKDYYANSAFTFLLDGKPKLGEENAVIKIVEFSDFECPVCKRAAPQLKSFLKDRKDIQLIFFNYPLDQKCNPLLDRKMHEQACDAAKAAICAQKQNNFWEYHDLLFANQEDLSQERLFAHAKKLNFDLTAFESCLKNPETALRLKAEIELGNKNKVEGTPTLFVNGRFFPGGFDTKQLEIVIQEEKMKLKK